MYQILLFFISFEPRSIKTRSGGNKYRDTIIQRNDGTMIISISATFSQIETLERGV